MPVYDVLRIVTPNEERTQQAQTEALTQANNAWALAAGQAMMAGADNDAAKAAGDEAAAAAGSYHTYYDADPAVIYPATLDHLEDLIKRNQPAPSKWLAQQLDAARALPADAWEWARTDRAEFDDGDSRLTQRAALLEIARLWFTETLHTVIARPLGLHLIRDDYWRL